MREIVLQRLWIGNAREAREPRLLYDMGVAAVVDAVGTEGAFALTLQGEEGAERAEVGAVVLATGARERFLPFPGWTLVVIAVMGEASAGQLLIFSQVVLSLQLPFAVVPLVWFTGNRAIMGVLAAPLWMRVAGWAIALVITVANAWLVLQMAGVVS